MILKIRTIFPQFLNLEEGHLRHLFLVRPRISMFYIFGSIDSFISVIDLIRPFKYFVNILW